ncbi:asparagine synthase (glutamine-hydrolyzing) [bacterium]|nr:asparagine synthase (glutamine-hydrolyzing) [bacterium]
MCGIAGIYNLKGGKPALSLLKQMGDTISHRGPDHEGYYINNQGIGFCHRRLSILDLSEKGNQPMASKDQKIWLVFNGEIYNYRELRTELVSKGYGFETETDTEVVINSYLEYGRECLTKFNGMFAFSLWDENNQLFFAGRDRIGIKPYYYHSADDLFVFGSEIKSLLVHPKIERSINESSITNYLKYSNPINNQTWFKDIYSLEPGSYLTIELGRINITKYWDIEFNIDTERSYESFALELKRTLIDSVKLHWQSDVPVGAHLSGGVDSSTIVSIASKFVTDDLHTFSSAFDLGKEFDEREEIETVVRNSKTQHHQTSITANDLKDKLETIIHHMDEPVVGPSILPMYRINESIKKAGVKVVNGGQGVDELFGGYPPFFSLAARNILLNYKKKSFPLLEFLYFPSYLSKGGTLARLKNKIFGSSNNLSWIKGYDSQEEFIKGYDSLLNERSELSPFEKASYTSLKYYLPALLHQEDRMSMAWSIESRTPMLDTRIIDLALTVPSWFKVNCGMSKSIFRAAVRGIVPDKILDNKIKRGYPTPISIWFSEDAYQYMYELLNGDEFLAGKYVDTSALIEILKVQRKNPTKNISFPLWQALVLHTWIKINFQDREKSSDY